MWLWTCAYLVGMESQMNGNHVNRYGENSLGWDLGQVGSKGCCWVCIQFREREKRKREEKEGERRGRGNGLHK